MAQTKPREASHEEGIKLKSQHTPASNGVVASVTPYHQ